VFAATSSAVRDVERLVAPILRADWSAGMEPGAAVVTAAVTEPVPATATVALSPPPTPDTTVPDDEIGETGALAPATGVGAGLLTRPEPPPLQAATPTAISATSDPRRTLSTKALRAKQCLRPRVNATADLPR